MFSLSTPHGGPHHPLESHPWSLQAGDAMQASMTGSTIWALPIETMAVAFCKAPCNISAAGLQSALRPLVAPLRIGRSFAWL